MWKLTDFMPNLLLMGERALKACFADSIIYVFMEDQNKKWMQIATKDMIKAILTMLGPQNEKRRKDPDCALYNALDFFSEEIWLNVEKLFKRRWLTYLLKNKTSLLQK